MNQAGVVALINQHVVVAACEAGMLGSVGSGMRSPDGQARQIAQIQKRTNDPFAVNFRLGPERGVLPDLP